MSSVVRKIMIILVLLLFSCKKIDKALCGELKGEWKNIYEKASIEYKDVFLIEPIPCESYYVNVFSKSDNIDTLKVKSLHKILYNEESKIGWLSLKIHSKQGKFLFSNHYSGKRHN